MVEHIALQERRLTRLRRRTRRWDIESKILLYLLEYPSRTKYQIEKDLQIGRESVYRIVPRLKKAELVRVTKEDTSRVGLKMEYYELTLPAVFRALASYFSVFHDFSKERDFASLIAANYKHLLPEIFGQWSHFVKFSKEELYETSPGKTALPEPSSERCAILNLSILVREFPPMHYGWSYDSNEPGLSKWSKRIAKETREQWKTRAMRIFIFGSDREDPSRIIWDEPWSSAVASNPVLSKWAKRIARLYVNKYIKAESRWFELVNELAGKTKAVE